MSTLTRALGAAALVLSVGAVASADYGQVRAFIPFEFSVKGETLPAGTYFVSKRFGSNDLVHVSGVKGGVLVFGDRTDSRSNDQPTRLIFHRYGERYFLNLIWLDGGTGYTMPQTIEERELQKRADAGSTPTLVTVFADSGSKAARTRP